MPDRDPAVEAALEKDDWFTQPENENSHSIFSEDYNSVMEP